MSLVNASFVVATKSKKDGLNQRFPKAQLIGIAFTVALALTDGLIAGFIIRATGSKKNIYEDHEEFIQTEQKGTVLEN